MSTDHQQLALKHVQAGMVLSDDVHDDHGVTLLTHGTVLTPAILTSLARHGIETVPIRQNPGSANSNGSTGSTGSNATDQEQQCARLDFLFRKENCDEASSLLHQYVTRYRLGGEA